MDENDVYVKLAGKVNFPKSRFIPMILKKLVTPEEAEMLLSLPATVAEFAAKYQLEEAAAERKLDEFARKGVSIPLEKEGTLRYFCVSNIIQVHDATIHATIGKKYEPLQEDIIELWKRFRETEWFEILRDMETLGILRGRAVPSWSTVKDHPDLLPFENLRAILKNAPAIAAVDCPCRWLQVQRGECDKPTFVCLSLTPGSVKYILDQGIGKQLTLDEGYELLEQCEQAGLIPTTGGKDKVRQLCFCETNECIILRPQVKYGYNLWDASRFAAFVEADLCKGCQTCVERCYFDAISMEKYPRSRKLLARVDAGKCFGCGLCAVTCPTKAIVMRLVRPVEHITGAVAEKA